MINSYELSDEQHIELYRAGDISQADFIMEKYKNLVKSKVSTMYILGGDKQDLIQEGMIGLFKAVRDYDSGRDASFSTFADLCVSRQIYNAIQASVRLKNQPLNDYVSLYTENVNSDGDYINTLADSLEADFTDEPERKIIDDESAKEIFRLIDTMLTQTERDVMMLHLTGLPTSKIAAILSIEAKSADNALQRAKSKLKKEIKK